MPESDFIIGVNAGDKLVGNIIDSRQKAQQLDIEKTYRDASLEQSRVEHELRRKMLEEQTRHQGKLEEYQKAQIDTMTLDRDWKLESRKRELSGLARAMEFDNEVNKAILDDPTGSSFFRRGVELRNQYSDLFASTSDQVRARAQAIESRGMEFLKSAEVSSMNKELAGLIEGGFLNPLERTIPQSVMSARKAKDESDARTLAASNGLNLEDVVGNTYAQAEVGPLGGWSPSYKAMVARQIEKAATARTNQNKPVDAKIVLDIPSDAKDSEGRPLVNPMTYAPINAGKVEFSLSEVQRSPYLMSIAEKTLGKSGMADLLKGGDTLRVRDPKTGQTGTMSRSDYELNLRNGKRVDIIGNTP